MIGAAGLFKGLMGEGFGGFGGVDTGEICCENYMGKWWVK